MTVIDAGVLANVLGDDGVDGILARTALSHEDEIVAPDLIDVETLAVLRKRWIDHTLTNERFDQAVSHLIALPFNRVPTRHLLGRAAELRSNIGAYDACYIALAEALTTDLLTVDGRLARAPGPRCTIRLIN